MAGDSLCVESPKADVEDYTFSAKRVAVPTALIAIGAVGVYAFPGLKQSVRDGMAEVRGGNYTHIDDKIQYAPVVTYPFLGFIGIPHRSSFKERLLVCATAYASLGIIVNLAKPLIGEKRPDSEARHSFPSGHSATAFMGAELLRIEYGTAAAVCGYTVAAVVGFLRMYNDRHWYNDVIAGAGVGMLCARIGYWLLPFERKLFKNDPKRDVAIIPCFGNSYTGVSFSMNF